MAALVNGNRSSHNASRPPTIVIGAGPIGSWLARKLAAARPVLVLDADPASPAATAQRTQLLQRLGMTRDTPAAPPLAPTPGLTHRSGTRVSRIDRQARCVVTATGERIAYHDLVLALGAAPVIPDCVDFAAGNSPGNSVQTAYSRADFHTLAAAATRGEALIIVGGGALATELAARLAAQTTVHLCARSRLLGHDVDAFMARQVARHLARLGVQVSTDCVITHCKQYADGATIELQDDRQLVGNRVILACGLRPRTQLARDADLTVADGIRVDRDMRTIDAHIFAVGDCAAPAAAGQRGNVALGIAAAQRALAALLNSTAPTATATTQPLRYINLGNHDLVTTTSADRPATPAKPSRAIVRRRRHCAFAITLDRERRMTDCQALLPQPQAARLSVLAAGAAPLSRSMVARLQLGSIPKPPDADPIVCQCANVRKSEIDHAMAEHGANLDAIITATGAGQHCGACIEQLATMVAGRPSKSQRRQPLVLAILALLASVMAAAWPTLTAGDNVRSLLFRAYTLFTSNGLRQLSGYISVACIIVALGMVAPRQRRQPVRNTLLHVVFGVLALALVPLHVLGGVTIGSGLNRVLIAAFLSCVLPGAVLLLKRSWRAAYWLHAAATAGLVAAILLHVVYVYQY